MQYTPFDELLTQLSSLQEFIKLCLLPKAQRPSAHELLFHPLLFRVSFSRCATHSKKTKKQKKKISSSFTILPSSHTQTHKHTHTHTHTHNTTQHNTQHTLTHNTHTPLTSLPRNLFLLPYTSQSHAGAHTEAAVCTRAAARAQTCRGQRRDRGVR